MTEFFGVVLFSALTAGIGNPPVVEGGSRSLGWLKGLCGYCRTGGNMSFFGGGLVFLSCLGTGSMKRSRWFLALKFFCSEMLF